MPIELPDATITHEHWMKLLILNIRNGSLTDAQFREFVNTTLPTVLAYDRVKQELIKSGKKIPDADITKPKVVHRSGSYNYQDAPMETQEERFGKK